MSVLVNSNKLFSFFLVLVLFFRELVMYFFWGMYAVLCGISLTQPYTVTILMLTFLGVRQ